MREITIIESTNEIQVRDIDTNHYEVYGAGMRYRFIAEVEDANKYIDLVNWAVVVQPTINPITDSASSASV